MLLGLVVGACGSDGVGSAAPTLTAPTTTTTTAPGSSPSTAAVAEAPLMGALERNGAAATFSSLFVGEVRGGPLVAIGVKDGQMVAYVCDGQTGTWLTGAVGELLRAPGGVTMKVSVPSATTPSTAAAAPAPVVQLALAGRDETPTMGAAKPGDALVRFRTATGVGGVIAKDQKMVGAFAPLDGPSDVAFDAQVPNLRLTFRAGPPAPGGAAWCDLLRNDVDAAVTALRAEADRSPGSAGLLGPAAGALAGQHLPGAC